jgi:uncharacterized protein HemY
VSAVWAVITLLNNLFAAFGAILAAVKVWQEKRKEEKRQARDKAIEDAKNAKTEGEFDDAQSRIVDGTPKP